RYVWMSAAMSSDLWAMDILKLKGSRARSGPWSPAAAPRSMHHKITASEVAFLLLLFHRSAAVVIDHAALPLGTGRKQHFLDDLGQRARAALDGAGERITAERAETHPAQLRLLARLEPHALVVHHDERAFAAHHRPLCREVQRHDGDVLQVDVLPDVELGPVRQRKHPQALALVLARVVQAPELRALAFRVPAMLGRAEREDPLLGPRLLLVTACAAEGGIEPVLVQRLLQALGFHDV